MNSRAENKNFTMEELIDWKVLELSPQIIFNLRSPHTKTEVHVAYHKLALQFHPDKNLTCKEKAEVVFTIIKDANDYLLWKLSPKDFSFENIRNNCFFITREQDSSFCTPLRKFSEKDGFNKLLNAFEMGYCAATIPLLKKYIQKNKNYLYSKTPFSRTVFYLAAQLNQVAFFEWLLAQEPSIPQFRTETGLNAIEIAISYNNDQILDCLIKHFGKEWLEEKLLNSLICAESENVLLKIYSYLVIHSKRLSPADLFQLVNKNPWLILVLANLGQITELQKKEFLKHALLKHPALYLHLGNSLQLDHSLIIAALEAGDLVSLVRSAIPYSQLSPYFAYALIDIWPKAKPISLFDNDQTPEYIKSGKTKFFRSDLFLTICTLTNATLVGLLIASSIISALLPVPAMIVICSLLVLTVCLQLYGISKAVSIDIEKRKIQKERRNLCFFDKNLDLESQISVTDTNLKINSE